MPLQEGQLIAGKYRILRPLGAGGMGAVYVAVNERLRKEVALKVLSDELATEPEVAARFVREAMSASAVKHPGIVEIYDADNDGGVLWIAMEKLDGESLADRLTRGPLPADQLFTIMAQVVSALSAVHRVGVIHRDLKPGNIFLERLPSGDERAKILDFGIAKASFEGMDKVTRTGMTIGTPDYLAPEQAMGGSAIDARTDIYAVGVILFEALSGTMPYEAHSFGELVAKMVREGPRDLSRVAHHVAAPIAHIVNLCLRVDPNDRPQTAEALGREIERLQRCGIAPTIGMPQAVGPASTPAPAPPGGVAPTTAMPMWPAVSAPGLVTPIVAPPKRSSTPLVLALAGAALLVSAGAIAGVTALVLGSRTEETSASAASAPSPPPLIAPPRTPAGCSTPDDCDDPMRERCNRETRACEPAPLWSDTRITYADQPEIHLTNCYFCDATLTQGRQSSLLLRFQQGGGLTIWSLTLPGDIEVGERELRRRAPGRGPSLYVAESSEQLSARFRGAWRQTGGTLEITSVDIRFGGHIAGTIRADVELSASHPPTTGRFTSTFRAKIPD